MRLAHYRSRPLCPVFRHRGHLRLPVRRVAQRTVQRFVLKSKKAHPAVTTLRDEDAFQGLTAILDVIKWKRNLVTVIVQVVNLVGRSVKSLLCQARGHRGSIDASLCRPSCNFGDSANEVEFGKLAESS